MLFRSVPGDEIVGFVTRGRGMTIHRTDCANVIHMPEGDRNRLIDAEWESSVAGEESTGGYIASIKIYARDTKGFMVEIAQILADMDIDMKYINGRASKKGIVTIDVEMVVGGRGELSEVMKKLRALKGVIDIERTVG